MTKHILLGLSIYCLIQTVISNFTEIITIKVGVLIVENMSEPFDLLRVGPALSIAFENIEQDFGIKFDPIYRNYSSPKRLCMWVPPVGILSELYYNDHVQAVIGPACSRGVETSSRLAQYLDLPMVSGLGDLALRTYPEDMFKTLTKLSYNLRKVSVSVSAFMEQYEWRHSVIIYDDKYRLWHVVGSNLVEDFRRIPRLARPYDIPFDPAKIDDYKDMLLLAKKYARVIIFICYAELFRTIMYQGYELGMANGDFVFITLEFFPSDWMGFYREFLRDDHKDYGVTKAYETVLIVTLTQPDLSDPEFIRFSDEVKRRAKDMFGYTFGANEKVNYFITAFYDSAIYLANVYNKTIYEGGDINDGMAVAQKLWNSSFEGITGPVAIDEIGERVADFDLLDMKSPITREFQTVGRFRGASQRYTQFAEIVWPNGQPIDMPTCGFSNELCIQHEESMKTETIFVINFLAVGVVVVALVVSAVLYRRLHINQLIAKRLWLVQPEEIVLRKMNINNSCLSKSRISLASRLTMATQTDISYLGKNQGQVVTQTGVCRSITVSVRALLTQTLDINKTLEREFHEMHKLSHPNLAKFVGACVKPDFLRLLMECCPRGSLQDVIHNDNIDLDWNFRYSLISDVIKGMVYLHSSPVQTHGRLSSTNCVIDNRFMLKLTDFGLHSVFNKERQEERILEANLRFRKMLWMAPELVRRMETSGIMDPSQPGDVYSFAIILQEIGMRAEPFQENNLEAHEIIAALVDGKTIRPVLTSSDCPQAILDMIEQCWDEKTSNRPTFVTIDQRFRKHRAGKSTNIMDNLLQRMSQYADNLEALAAERTKQYLEEKTRTEELLLRLLPKSVVHQLESGNSVVPELFESVTVYFSDIVGFTTMAASSTPIQVVDFLNSLFTKFDKTVNKYDVYKVETIGDAYMVVSGLPERNGTRHVSEVADMALSVVAVVKRFKIKHIPNHPLRIRIGIHSGPVVAGVVGLTMPRYCLFGDTVNTASRMESTSEPMKIQLSSGTKEVIDIYPRFIVEERGETEVKGKGKMKTYWLLSNVDDATPGQQLIGNQRLTVVVDPILQTDRE